ncbi:MAG: hypothetical protein C0404_03480 [Verrucomicrobia bacterium]|nr:hypothetical protein [Verrucomicrobiota bacterium]
MKWPTQEADSKTSWSTRITSMAALSLLAGLLVFLICLLGASDNTAALLVRAAKAAGFALLAAVAVAVLMFACYISADQRTTGRLWIGRMTDELRLHFRLGRKNEVEVVALVMDALIRRDDFKALATLMRDEFKLTDNEISLALDRIERGIAQALSGEPENEPNQTREPLAWLAFNVVWKDLARVEGFSNNRVPDGPWYDWFTETRQRKDDQRRLALGSQDPAGAVAGGAALGDCRGSVDDHAVQAD